MTGWEESVASIMELSRNLAKKKAEIGQAEFVKFGETEYGLSRSSLGKIISISTHPILADPKNWEKLPAEWAKLYEMRALPERVLREKIDNGEIKTASKYKIWDWRGVRTKKPRHPNGGGGRVSVPENTSLVAYVNAGMIREDEFGGDLKEVAKALGIGSWTYKMVRQIILLSKFPDLSDKDSDLIDSVIEKVNKTRNVREHWNKLRPLMEKVWGDIRGQKITKKLSSKRVEAYLNSVFLVGVSAQGLANTEVPYMSIEDTDKAIVELREAGVVIRKLAENLRRSKNG